MDKVEPILIGGGGHASAIWGFGALEKDWRSLQFCDPNANAPLSKFGRCLGSEHSLNEELITQTPFIFALGHLYPNPKRLELFHRLLQKGFRFPTLVSTRAITSVGISVDQGTIVFPGVIIGSQVSIGRNCIINSGAIVEHGTMIGDNVHVAPGAVINGGCKVEANSVIGSNSTLVQGVSLGQGSMVKANSLVARSI